MSPASVLFWLTAVLWALVALKSLHTAFRLQLLPPLVPGTGRRPRVSVVVAARDEEARVETTVRRLLAQEGVDLDLVAVDDRSTDGTGDLLRRVAADDRRLTVVRVDALPEGWLGKCNALHLGAGKATGEWVLFTDGDVWLRPDVVARAVQQAEAKGVEHVTLVPGVPGATFLGSVTQLLMNLALGRRAVRVNRDVAGAHLGVGAFNLVRADAYRAIGGHVPLRLEVVDDLKLGLLLRRAGRRTRVFFAPGDADADWCSDMWGLLRLMRKNHFAAAGYRVWPVVAVTAVLALVWGAAVVGPWTGAPSGVAAGVGLMALSVPAGIAAVRLRRPVGAAVLVPLFVPMVALSLVNSAVATLWRGGVRWRDTFYPLALLRAGSVR